MLHDEQIKVLYYCLLILKIWCRDCHHKFQICFQWTVRRFSSKSENNSLTHIIVPIISPNPGYSWKFSTSTVNVPVTRETSAVSVIFYWSCLLDIQAKYWCMFVHLSSEIFDIENLHQRDWIDINISGSKLIFSWLVCLLPWSFHWKRFYFPSSIILGLIQSKDNWKQKDNF